MKDPYTYRQELLDKAKLSNEEAVDLIFKKFKEGHTITVWGSTSGPYTKHCTYFVSDGTMIETVSAAPMNWIDLNFLLEKQ